MRRTFGERHPRGNATSSGKHPARDETPKGRRSACAQCRGDTKEQGSSGPCGLHSVCVGDNSLLQGHRHKEVWFPRGGDYSHERETTQPKRNHHHHPTCLKPHRLPTKVDDTLQAGCCRRRRSARRGARRPQHETPRDTHPHWERGQTPHTSLTHSHQRSRSDERKSDERWRHLTHLYRGEETASLPLGEHLKRWTEAGWDFTRVLRAHPRHPPCTWKEVMDLSGGGFQMLQSGYTAPSQPLPRFCDYCGRQCTAECRCGEAYCDKDCQAKDWQDHREICETVAENSEMAMTITKHSWGANGVLR